MLESREQNAASSNTIQYRIAEQESTEVHHHRYNVRSKYEFIRTLGKGTYGKVKLAVEKGTGRNFAVKTIRKDRIKDKKDMKHIRREMKIMSSLRHPNIIQIHEVFENHDKIVIVMEYAPRGELYDYLADKKLTSEVESRTFFKQIVSAVQYCHKLGVVHRDLKLENILLGEDHEIKIADFGLANLFKSDQLLHTFCGSPLYASPEIVNGVPYTGPEVDSWSLGVLLYALVYGMMPFDGSDYKMLTKQISNGEYSKQTKHPDAADLINKMLTVDPLERADIHQIANHYWMHQSPSNSTTVTSKQETVQSMDKNSNYIYSPHEEAYQHTATATSFMPISSPLNGYLSQTAMRNGYISPQQQLSGGSPVEQLSNGTVRNGYISPHQHLASTSPSEQLASGTVLTPCALENCENTTCPLNQRKGILKRFSAPVMTTNLNPIQGTLAPQHPTWPPQYASPVQSNCLNGAMFVKDASCGLQAKDSLKLKSKPLGASGKRRTLRSKKDRESGYYSSPERTPVEVQPVHSTTPVFTFAAPVIKPQLTNMTPESLKPRQQSQNTDTMLTQPHYGVPTYGYVMPIPPQPIPIIEGQTMSYYSPVAVQNSMEPTAGVPVLPYTVTPLNDEDTQSRRPRPISTYSDSSILSSDSFELCTFESPLTSTALFTTMGLTQGNTVMHATQPPPQFLLSTMRPASLPIPVPELPADVPGRSSSPVPSGALTPTSAKLNHDLSQILAPNRPRRRKAQVDSAPAKLGEEQANQLEEMMRQLNIDLERACNQGLDNNMKVSLTASAEV